MFEFFRHHPHNFQGSYGVNLDENIEFAAGNEQKFAVCFAKCVGRASSPISNIYFAEKFAALEDTVADIFPFLFLV